MDILTPHLDGTLREPLYSQLYGYVKKEILEGRLMPSERLPSKKKLAAHLGVSQNTVEAAYEQLALEGYVASVSRSGYYVNAIDELRPLQGAPETVEPEPPERRFRYDFSPGGVDLDSFPSRIWKRIHNEIMDEDRADFLLPGNPQGHSGLRDSIAAYLYQSRGVVCRGGQIVVSSGIVYLIQLLIQLLGRDCVFGLENPGYEKVYLTFKHNDTPVLPVPLDEHGISPDRLAESGAAAVYVSPSHQYPVGMIMPVQRRIRLLNWANESPGRYIVEDDYDSEFIYNGKPVPALQGLDKNGRVIYLGTFSKALTFGLRVSYMVLPPSLLEAYRKNLSFYACPVPVMEQKCLHAFIERGHFERHLNRMRSIYKKKRELLVRELGGISPRISITGANAGLHLLLSPNNGMSEEELLAKALARDIRLSGLSRCVMPCDGAEEEPIAPPTVLLAYAAASEDQIVETARILREIWF